MMRQVSNARVLATVAAILLAGAWLAASAHAADKTDHASVNDGEILAQLNAINENEVHAAQLAEKKNAEGPVLSFAKMLREDHGRNINDTEKLGDKLNVDLKKSTAVDGLRDEGERMLDRLDALKGDEFERSFLQEMVNGHREALEKLDEWIRVAQNPEVKSHLQATRSRVSFHLKEAERLQASSH